MTIRNLIALILVLSGFPPTYASDNLQRNDLSQVATLADQEKLPVLLIVTQHFCPFCVQIKEEIIYPMQISGDYKDKVIMTEVMLDSPDDILDFQGKSVTPSAFADSYKVWVTPTLLFLDHTGKEIHKRMLGVNTIEMYNYYLDSSLGAALRSVRKGDQSYLPTKKDILGNSPGYDQLR